MGNFEVLAVLCGATFAAPMLAALFATKVKASRTISDLNCMASGIFTGITFFHIISESFEKIEPIISPTAGMPKSAEEMGQVIKIQNGLFLAGFVIMLWLDRVAFGQAHSNHNHENLSPDGHGHGHGHSRGHAHEAPKPQQQLRPSAGALAAATASERDSSKLLAVAAGEFDRGRRPRSPARELKFDGSEGEAMSDHIEVLVLGGGDEGRNSIAGGHASLLRGSVDTSHDDLLEIRRQRIMANGLFGAFVVHSVIEGLAFGAEEYNAELFIIFLIFAAHKGLDGLAVSLPLARVYNMRSYWLMVVAFSCATPAGLALSFLMLQDGGPLESFAGVVEAISGGVFMYIALFHIFAEELETKDHIVRKIVIFTMALSFMCIVEFNG